MKDVKCKMQENLNEVVIDLTYPQESKWEIPSLHGENFRELKIFSDGLLVKLKKSKETDEFLEKGITINNEYQSLVSKPVIPEKRLTDYSKPQSLYEPPPEKSSIEKIKERLAPNVSQPLKEEPVSGIEEPQIDKKRIWEDPETGEIVDLTNAEVLGYAVDKGPEWRAFDDEQRAKRTRVGAPLTYTIHDKGLTTEIDWHDRDVYGKNLSPDQKAQVYRLRKWQRRIRVSNATERNLAFALADITKIANNLNLPKNVLETASVTYRKAVKERLIRGRSIQGVVAAATYLACRQCGLARTLEEIAQASSVNKKEVGRSYRFLVKELDYTIPLLKPSQYITKFSNQLTMQGKVEETAYKILAAAKEAKLTSGRGPTGIAAASSYIASVLTGERKTQREIAEIANVTEVTIRNRYKELVERLMIQTSH
jgi:transcription initiation factor TFIIB